MAIVKCPECGNEVSTQADACPKCGAKRAKPSGGMGKTFGLLLILLVLWLAYSIDKNKAAFIQPTPDKASASAGFAIIDFACGGEYGHTWATGHVKNNSGEKTSAVKITASFYAADKSLIDTGWSYAEMTPLLPGQTSGFKVYGPHNQKVKTCSVDGAG